jgi:uncharacterized membrane protein YkvA (DUF1232 family)
MGTPIDTLKGWAEALPQDVAVLKRLVEADGANGESRRLAAAALSYLVTRMDLVPDWNAGIGALDDVMVVRVCAALALQHPIGDLPGDAEVALSRLADEADQLVPYLGRELFDKLRAYCARLVGTAVRGRTPAMAVDDAEARAALYAAVDDEVRKSLPVLVEDAEEAELNLKAYLAHKLG